jgi:hypothetical protein
MRVSNLFSLFSCVFIINEVSANPSTTQLDAWEYIHQAAIAESQNRQESANGYFVAGGVAIILPFVASKRDSPVRPILRYTLIPLGVSSLAYGGYLKFTSSSWESAQNRILKLSGAVNSPDNEQYALRRELRAREALFYRAKSQRMWRYIWGGVEGAAGMKVLLNSLFHNQAYSTASLTTAFVLIGLSTYQFLHLKPDEEMAKQLQPLHAREQIHFEMKPILSVQTIPGSEEALWGASMTWRW